MVIVQSMRGACILSTHRPPNEEHLDDEMIKMEVNLDDISGEWLGYVMDLLFEAGANDVFYSPIYMKKNRPGILLQLLSSRSNLNRMKDILFKETTTLGIRYYPLTVHRLERSFKEISTEWGSVTVKEGFLAGELVQRSPEFDDCKKIARQHNVPLKKVYEQVWKKFENES
ncbi:LarC family nickel insertion protein [Metabacillus sp. DBTR6]|uniref:LarC family nickel insertion protein n=1 Tax=Metabacillus rhizolycopersici TaxID=2875709 RepID=A0ABS7URK7_9BACI|nr:LarC family nickel insertion protein [Metabacillus rhizolycopersici]